MPSAASVKIDKQVNSENALADPSQNLTPLRQAITIIEHKIRNLEKRKSKLESYKELQNAGKELNADQKTAVAKFNEVINTLDFARDLSKQFLSIATDALNQMGNENVRDDFLHGRNGAAQLSEIDLKLLDDLYPAVTPKHEAGNPTAFTNEVQAAAEHLLAVVDGKPKDVFGGTYSQTKEILGKIHESGYFDQAQVFESYVETDIVVETEAVPIEPVLNHEVVPPQEQQPTLSMPIIESLTIETRPAVHPQQPPVEPQPPIEQALPPEQIYFQPPPQPQPPRPITEMLGTGSFFFLQVSTLNFGSHPPHPVPLAAHFSTIPNNLPPTNHVIPQVGNNGIDDGLIQPEDQIPHKEPSAGINRGPPRSANNQSYYQNNNGYNNRPRHQNQNRNNGTRPANNRHN
ncbi:hypothetical protein NQ314_000686 [Rhamnusium bicolor]|uniref:Caprin-1 dimerization domain-containing protein n=1 Tax=Rhamnusium bicolor TaxID=1586634 RepID=A0AAV8ZUI7_9CUCU|nr:hypothetical protein NQ314_000686 [Rhamnusium bicolor]